MIRIKKNINNKLIIKDYPTKYWLAFIILTIFTFVINYCTFYIAPIYSSLTCHKSWLNKTTCEIFEYSLGNKNLVNQKINNLHEPKELLRNGTIWLKTEVDLLHNHIKNIYYPSHRFLGFFDIFIYRFHWQAAEEIIQIDSFINGNNNKTLKIIRKTPFLFYIPILLLPFTIIISIIAIVVQPIDTYLFDLNQNQLVVRSNILSIWEEKIYSLDQLNIIYSSEMSNQRISSILLKIDEQKIANFNDFTDTKASINLFNLLKQYIK